MTDRTDYPKRTDAEREAHNAEVLDQIREVNPLVADQLTGKEPFPPMNDSGTDRPCLARLNPEDRARIQALDDLLADRDRYKAECGTLRTKVNDLEAELAALQRGVNEHLGRPMITEVQE